MRSCIIALSLGLVPLSLALAQSASPSLPAGHPPISSMSPTTEAMQHGGAVIETADAPPYVYVHVKSDKGTEWLAAPAIKLKVGARIVWPDGLVMTNYHSKILDRTFDSVSFVTAVAPEK
jgi:hypothetical protein